MKIVNLTHFFGRESARSLRQRSASLTSSLIKMVLIGVISCGATISGRAATIFVSATDLNINPFNPNMVVKDGTSWKTAFSTLSGALSAAAYASLVTPGAASQIWIAAGEYPMPTNYYPLPNNVDIYGGFNGNETAVTQRLFNNNLPVSQTTLLDDPNFSYSSSNPYPDHLFYLKGTTNKFNGLRFVGSGGILQEGGNLTVTNSLFSRDRPSSYALGGNGIFSFNNATLTVDKSYFLKGEATRGGAIDADNAASVTITGSTFSYNKGGDWRCDLDQW